MCAQVDVCYVGAVVVVVVVVVDGNDEGSVVDDGRCLRHAVVVGLGRIHRLHRYAGAGAALCVRRHRRRTSTARQRRRKNRTHGHIVDAFESYSSSS